ncbi:hypothetical protein [Anoxybacillus flavithermus]|uniref:hypothetical protein n=1 Tax=Anoxybacillus flavithermus TaxID=33934 RepID=UPI00054DF34C|nr:hypothetical protein [Anoxybacillus flavithermus]
MNITSRRLEILDKMLEEYSYKYGYYSVAGLLIKYYILITSLDLFVNCEDKYKYDLYVNLKEATDLVLDHYQKAERSPTISQNTWSYEVEINGEKFYKFDPEIYEKYYSNSGEIIQKNW